MTIKEAFEKLTATCSAGMKNPFFIMRNLHDAFADIAGKIEGGGGGSTVEVTQVVSSGTKIATITVDDTPTDLYTPEDTGSEVSVTQVVSTGTKIATITVDDTPTDLYAPSSGGGGGDWTLIDTKSGQAEVTLPDGWKELFIQTSSLQSGNKYHTFTVHVLSSALNIGSNGNQMGSGWYFGDADYHFAKYNVTLTKSNLVYACNYSVDITSSCTTNYFYK